jgi:prepilin-type N-terminal cleavage/methylation domain-containing protein
MSRPLTAPASHRSQAGFTLIELMTVVVILGVLAAVAIGAYTRHVRNAHKSEVISDMSNIALKQKTFRAVQGHYASSTDTEGDGNTFPLMATLFSANGPVRWDTSDPLYTLAGQGDAPYFRGGGDVHGFDALRFMPEGGESFCGYATISGHGTNAGDPVNADEPPTATLATEIFPAGSDPYFAGDWFYAYGLCDFDHDGEYWAFTAVHYEDSVNSTAVGPYLENE